MASQRRDWYLTQWLRALGKKQADLVKALEMNKAKVSLTASGKQPYTRDDVNAVSEYLELQPYELLMDPADAMAIRQLRASAETIVTLAPDNPPTKLNDERVRRALAARDSAERKRKTD